jgi:hypothetical protein
MILHALYIVFHRLRVFTECGAEEDIWKYEATRKLERIIQREM